MIPASVALILGIAAWLLTPDEGWLAGGIIVCGVLMLTVLLKP